MMSAARCPSSVVGSVAGGLVSPTQTGTEVMERANLERLQVYRLAQKLADEVWEIVLNWDTLARSTVGSQPSE